SSCPHAPATQIARPTSAWSGRPGHCSSRPGRMAHRSAEAPTPTGTPANRTMRVAPKAVLKSHKATGNGTTFNAVFFARRCARGAASRA
ncbi:hypothetical protein AAVH_39989, partial [Aphelenchoides avenae]